MAAIHETAYPRIKLDLSKKDITRLYQPTDEEISWTKRKRWGTDTELLGLVYLKCFQRLHYFPKTSDIPTSIIIYLSAYTRAKVGKHFQFSNIAKTTTKRLKDAIRQYCEIDAFLLTEQRCELTDFATTMARTKENTIDIINALIEHLVHRNVELPAFSTLNRVAHLARIKANKKVFDAINDGLTPLTKELLASLLTERNDSESTTHWHQLKTEPKKPSIKALLKFVKHTAWVNELQAKVGNLPDIPEEKRCALVLEARAYTSSKMREIQPSKRTALQILMINEQCYCCTDFLIDFFVREVRKIHNKARKDLQAFHDNSVQESESLIGMLRDVSHQLTLQHTANNTLNNVLSVLNHAPEKVVTRCDKLIGYGYDNYLQFLPTRYTKPLRRALLTCLSLLDIDHTAHGGDLLRCLDVIHTYRYDNLKVIAVKAIDESRCAIDWIGDQWNRVLFTEQKANRINRFMRMNVFELCVISEIAKRFVAGDIFVHKSYRYHDYRRDLVSTEDFSLLVDDFTAQVGLIRDPKKFVEALKSDFVDTATIVDASIPDNHGVVINHDHIALKKQSSDGESIAQKRFGQAINELLPDVSILDLLLETLNWAQLENCFGPISGHQKKVRDYKKRLVCTLLCYGCNLGPTQTARSIKSLTRKQIAYLNLSHTREKDLIQATENIINAYNHYELPKQWGTGESASVDGTRFDMYEQNLLSEYHLRYASHGGIGYYLVSDKYIALFSRFIPCGVREAMYLLDGIIENDSDIQPNRVHGDTHAQSTIIFGLAHLLGITLMPRIANINSLIMFKPDRRIQYQHINGLFSEGINYTLIKDHYEDMLRVAISIREGRLTAATIARRLGSRGIRNSLYYAFRELGRVIRTQFLLQYISDIELRQTIHASTCKSEEFNEFIQRVFFFNKGEIQANLRHEQNKIVKYNHLVANQIILHNVNAMTKAINQLKRDRYPITPELLAKLSPYRTEHINFLGDYTVDTGKRPGKQVVALK